MKKISFKQIEIIGAVFGFFLGSFLHFAYELSGNSTFVALFAPINESVWEHNKLFFFPIMIFLIVEWFYVKDKKTLLLAKVLEVLFGITFIISFFYTYTGAFGIENIWIDIASFGVAVVVGKLISYKVITSRIKWQGYLWLHTVVLVLIALFFFVVTFNPPKIPLFLDSETQTYGIYEQS